MDNSPTALFENYEQEYQQVIDSVRDTLEGDGKDQRGEQRKASLRRVEMELDEADEMVSQMEIEIQSIPHNLRPQYQTRLRTARTDLSKYKKGLREQSTRSDLFSSPGDFATSDEPYGAAASSDRQRLLAGTAQLEDGTKRLQESQRLALETEEQGADILRNLRQQGETITHARSTLDSTMGHIDRASGTLKSMVRRMYQDRLITYSIIAVLVFLIGFIVYAKLFN